MKRSARKTVSICLISIVALSVAGCATIVTAPVMAVSTPVSCTVKDAKDNGAAALLFAPFAIPFEAVFGFVNGLMYGFYNDVKFAAAGGDYSEYDAEAVLNPCD